VDKPPAFNHTLAYKSKRSLRDIALLTRCGTVADKVADEPDSYDQKRFTILEEQWQLIGMS